MKIGLGGLVDWTLNTPVDGTSSVMSLWARHFESRSHTVIAVLVGPGHQIDLTSDRERRLVPRLAGLHEATSDLDLFIVNDCDVLAAKAGCPTLLALTNFRDDRRLVAQREAHGAPPIDLGFADRIVALSSSVALDAVERSPARVTLVPPPIRSDLIDRLLPSGSHHRPALFASRLSRAKGVMAFLDSVEAAGCSARVYDFADPTEPETRDLVAARIESMPKVELVPSPRTPTAWMQELRSARVVVIPSTVEAVGLVGIEAMAVGTPVITTASGGVLEYATDLMRSVPLDDLAEALAGFEPPSSTVASTAAATVASRHHPDRVGDLMHVEACRAIELSRGTRMS